MTRTVVHTNPWFSVTSQQHAGRTWFRIEAPDSAVLVGRTALGGVLLVCGHRPAAHGVETLELPGGMVEPGETPLEAAVRETAEEAGHLSRDPRSLGSFLPVPAISGNRCHVVGAQVTPAGAPQLEHGEDWAAEVVDVADLPALVASGRIQDGTTLAALALAGLLGAGTVQPLLSARAARG